MILSLLRSFAVPTELYVNFHQGRGLDDEKLLPYFPFRDDGLRILKVIEGLVEDYVNL